MGRRVQKFFVHVALSAVAAIVTPAMAAGLIAGASAGTQALSGAIYPSDDASGPEAGADPSAATVMHGPRKLSVLAGNDQAARQSARSVHVEFAKHPSH